MKKENVSAFVVAQYQKLVVYTVFQQFSVIVELKK